jgi:hypothetical protein
VSNGFQQAEERVLAFDRGLQKYLADHPRTDPVWNVLGTYGDMLTATQRYADAALKDAIWSFAQSYVDIATTGVIGSTDARHAEIPSEFADLYQEVYDKIVSTNPPSAADEIQVIYDTLMAAMWDAVTIGIIPRQLIIDAGGAGVAIGHIRANETLFRQEAEVIYEVKQAYKRLAPITLAIEAQMATLGPDSEPPEIAYQLVFYTVGEDGKERPPVWAEIHMALIGSQISVELAKRNAQDFRETLKDTAVDPKLRQFGNDLGDLFTALGGVAGVLTIAAVLVGGVFLYRAFQKG